MHADLVDPTEDEGEVFDFHLLLRVFRTDGDSGACADRSSRPGKPQMEHCHQAATYLQSTITAAGDPFLSQSVLCHNRKPRPLFGEDNKARQHYSDHGR